jgi:hypothetical protein
LAAHPGGRAAEPYAATSISHAPTVEVTTTDEFEEVSVRSEERSPLLIETQIQHIFEQLARQHRSLNVRGYPFTSDVTDEQEMLFPSTRLVTRDEIEDAWDDWSDERCKYLFRRHRHRADGDHDRHYRRHHPDRLRQSQWEVIFRELGRAGVRLDPHGFPMVDQVHEEQRERYPHTHPASREEIEEAWEAWIDAARPREYHHDRYRDEDEYNEDDGRDTTGTHDDRRESQDGTLLRHAQLHHIFEVLNHHKKILNPEGYPYRSDVREEQVGIYPGTRPASYEDVRRGWHSWHDAEAKDVFWERTERAWEADRARSGEQRERRHQHEHGRGEQDHERDTQRLFEIFDQMILEHRLSSDNLPVLPLVNRRCRACGLPEFETHHALLRDWQGYLVAAASAREAEMHETRAGRGGDQPERQSTSELSETAEYEPEEPDDARAGSELEAPPSGVYRIDTRSAGADDWPPEQDQEPDSAERDNRSRSGGLPDPRR